MSVSSVVIRKNIQEDVELRTYESSSSDEFVVFPDWFLEWFPLLSTNPTFRTIISYFVALWLNIVNSFLVRQILLLLSIIHPLFVPTIVITKWVVWLIRKILIEPLLVIQKKICSFLGITEILKKTLTTIVRTIDFYGDEIFGILGKTYIFLKERWNQIKEDIIAALKSFRTFLEDCLRGVVRVAKYLYINGMEFLEMILPANTETWLSQWMEFYVNLLVKVYNVTKLIMSMFEEVLTIISDTWNEDTPYPSNRHPEMCGVPVKSDGAVITEVSTTDVPASKSGKNLSATTVDEGPTYLNELDETSGEVNSLPEISSTKGTPTKNKNNNEQISTPPRTEEDFEQVVHSTPVHEGERNAEQGSTSILPPESETSAGHNTTGSSQTTKKEKSVSKSGFGFSWFSKN